MTLKEFILLMVPTKIERELRLRINRRNRFPLDSTAGRRIYSTKVSPHAILHRTAEVDDGVYVGSYVCIGKYSYIHSGSEVLSASIGNFCSIATNVHIGMFAHPVDNISTSSRLYLRLMDEKNFYSDIPSPAIIGNDVWIGSNATILGGVIIGDGAVIGAGAVVTKNVPPYAIVGGVPAHVIRYRFDQKKIDQLETIAWWNWDDEKIKRNQAFFEANKDEVMEEIQ